MHLCPLSLLTETQSNAIQCDRISRRVGYFWVAVIDGGLWAGLKKKNNKINKINPIVFELDWMSRSCGGLFQVLAHGLLMRHETDVYYLGLNWLTAFRNVLQVWLGYCTVGAQFKGRWLGGSVARSLGRWLVSMAAVHFSRDWLHSISNVEETQTLS